MSKQPSRDPMRQIQISMPISMINEIDEIVQEDGGSRSQKIREFSQKALISRNNKQKRRNHE